MNFQRIARMAICYWSEEDQSYIVKSPIFGNAVGLGATPEEARNSFDASLAGAREAFEQGKLVTVQSSDSNLTNTISMQVEVQSRTDRTLHRLMKKLDCSQDEAIDYLALFFEHARLIDGKISSPT
jgi:predicted RNase H-like HicB family nuclease